MADRKRVISQRERNVLFHMFKGRCASCGCALERDWEADHVTRFADGGLTLIENHQPLCPPCHSFKTKMENTGYTLRKHQQAAITRANGIVLGEIDHDVTVANVTPGGGKSGLVEVFVATLFKADLIDLVIWVCPRRSLAEQAVGAFDKQLVQHRIRAQWSPNKEPLLTEREMENGVRCYSTTYQSVVSQPDLHKQMMRDNRTLLVLDEPHHLNGEEPNKVDKAREGWHVPFEDMAALAEHTLCMTGTIERHDGKPIPIIPYFQKEDGKWYPSVDITYTRREAIDEHAKIKLNFKTLDGPVEYTDKDGLHIDTRIADADEATWGETMTAALQQDKFLQAAATECMEHFKQYRDTQDRKAQMIAVLDRKATARKLARWVRNTWSMKVAIALSGEGREHQIIEEFRKGKYDCLFTVGMAYEGLDAPRASHGLILNKNRSLPWQTQAVDRFTRWNYEAPRHLQEIEGSPGTCAQRAYIFTTQDYKMLEIVRQLEEEEQINGIGEEEEPAGGGGGGGGGGGEDSAFESLAAAIDSVSYTDREGYLINDEDVITIRRAHAWKVQLRFVDHNDLLDMVRKGQLVIPEDVMPGDLAKPPAGPGGFDPEQMDNLRSECQELAIEIDTLWRRVDPTVDRGTANERCKRQFGKAREDMLPEELVQARDWLQAQRDMAFENLRQR